MQEVYKDYIFPSFVYSMKLEDVDNSCIIKDCFDIKNKTESVLMSNNGGWQSPVLEEKTKTLSLKILEQKTTKAVQFVLESERVCGLKVEPYYWININNTDNYNVLHNHVGTFISAVYYPFIPEDCISNLTFQRTDGGSYFDVHREDSSFVIPCKTNRLVVFSPHLFHYVSPNNSKKDRISIAFNFERPRK